jgi:hypothetical protein
MVEESLAADTPSHVTSQVVSVFRQDVYVASAPLFFYAQSLV